MEPKTINEEKNGGNFSFICFSFYHLNRFSFPFFLRGLLSKINWLRVDLMISLVFTMFWFAQLSVEEEQLVCFLFFFFFLVVVVVLVVVVTFEYFFFSFPPFNKCAQEPWRFTRMVFSSLGARAKPLN